MDIDKLIKTSFCASLVLNKQDQIQKELTIRTRDAPKHVMKTEHLRKTKRQKFRGGLKYICFLTESINNSNNRDQNNHGVERHGIPPPIRHSFSSHNRQDQLHQGACQDPFDRTTDVKNHRIASFDLVEYCVILRSVLDDIEEAREEANIQTYEHAVLQTLPENRTLDDVEIALNVLCHD